MQLQEINYSEIIFRVDAQLSPSIAKWLIETFGVKAASLTAMQLREADDEIVYMVAKRAIAILISKDKDMLRLLARYSAPPKVIWLTCGNTFNAVVKQILQINFDWIIDSLITNNDSLKEITD